VRLICPHSSLLPRCLLNRKRENAKNGSHQMIRAVHKHAIDRNGADSFTFTSPISG
jgi:hypothetical protein